MSFMNDYDRDIAVRRFTRAARPNRLALALMVDNLANWTDTHSDGWAYWRKPSAAAARAIELIESTTSAANAEQERVDITDADMIAAARPVKSFLTRHSALVTRDDRDQILRSIES